MAMSQTIDKMDHTLVTPVATGPGRSSCRRTRCGPLWGPDQGRSLRDAV
jgi:hypothetical protein